MPWTALSGAAWTQCVLEPVTRLIHHFVERNKSFMDHAAAIKTEIHSHIVDRVISKYTGRETREFDAFVCIRHIINCIASID